MSTWPPEAKAESSLRTPSRLPRITFSILPAMRTKSSLASFAGSSGPAPAFMRSSGFLQAPIADGLREGKHRAGERRAVLHRAHYGIGDQHFDAACANVVGARGVRGVDDEAVNELEVFERHPPRRSLVAQFAHDLACRALERAAADDRRYRDDRRLALAHQFAHAGNFQDRADGVVRIGRTNDHRLEIL